MTKRWRRIPAENGNPVPPCPAWVAELADDAGELWARMWQRPEAALWSDAGPEGMPADYVATTITMRRLAAEAARGNQSAKAGANLAATRNHLRRLQDRLMMTREARLKAGVLVGDESAPGGRRGWGGWSAVDDAAGPMEPPVGVDPERCVEVVARDGTSRLVERWFHRAGVTTSEYRERVDAIRTRAEAVGR